jgi:hypothetical protein
LATKPFPRRPSVAKQTTPGFAVAGIDNPLFTPNQPHASVTPKRASRRHRLNSKPTRTPQAARADRAGHRGPDSREITISGRCRVRPFGLGHIADGGALPLRWRHPTLASSEALGVERIMTPWPTVVRAVFATPALCIQAVHSTPGPMLTQPGPLADVEDERIVKSGTRVVRCANPRPTPIGSSTRCATAAFAGETIPFPKLAPASRRAGSHCAGLSGPPRASPRARPRQAGRGRPRRRVSRSLRRAVALRAPGAAQRERRADLRQPSATPNLVPNHCDCLGGAGGPGRGSRPAGGSPQPP